MGFRVIESSGASGGCRDRPTAAVSKKQRVSTAHMRWLAVGGRFNGFTGLAEKREPNEAGGSRRDMS